MFARLVSGAIAQPEMAKANAALDAPAAERFLLACNRKENDEHWASDDRQWVGRASMSERHRFLLLKPPAGLHFDHFNVLVMGVRGPGLLRRAVETLEAMREAALSYTRADGGWSKSVGLYLHCYPFNSVQALHLHVVDLAAVGPTFTALSHKNLQLDAALEVLREELESPPVLPLRGTSPRQSPLASWPPSPRASPRGVSSAARGSPLASPRRRRPAPNAAALAAATAVAAARNGAGSPGRLESPAQSAALAAAACGRRRRAAARLSRRAAVAASPLHLHGAAAGVAARSRPRRRVTGRLARTGTRWHGRPRRARASGTTDGRRATLRRRRRRRASKRQRGGGRSTGWSAPRRARRRPCKRCGGARRGGRSWSDATRRLRHRCGGEGGRRAAGGWDDDAEAAAWAADEEESARQLRRHTSATRLQSLHRGRSARRLVGALHAAAEVAEAHADVAAEEAEEAAEEAADAEVVAAQAEAEAEEAEAAARAMFCMEAEAEKEAAALSLQSGMRARWARKDVEKRRERAAEAARKPRGGGASARRAADRARRRRPREGGAIRGSSRLSSGPRGSFRREDRVAGRTGGFVTRPWDAASILACCR